MSKAFNRLQSRIVRFHYSLCRGWLKDIPRRGVASEANVIYRRHYTGCVDNGMASSVLVDTACHSVVYSDGRAVKQQQQMFA